MLVYVQELTKEQIIFTTTLDNSIEIIPFLLVISYSHQDIFEVYLFVYPDLFLHQILVDVNHLDPLDKIKIIKSFENSLLLLLMFVFECSLFRAH